MREGKFNARITYYSMGHKPPKPPYVIIEFSFEDEGRDQDIVYIGSLSDKARPFTLENLKGVGYTGNLEAWDELQNFIKGEAGLHTEDINLKIVAEEYKGKTRFKVKYFNSKNRNLSDEEQYDLAKSIFEYKATGAKAAPKAKPKPKPATQEFATAFDPDETLDGDGAKVPF